MKALSLTQPFATLIALGAKRIETRSWSTSYRGQIAIHAAKGFPRSERELCYTDPFYGPLMERYDEVANLLEDALPTSAIIAVCDVISCVKIGEGGRQTYGPLAGFDAQGTARNWIVPPPESEAEHAFGIYVPGRFAWLLENLQELSSPVPCKGALSLWEVPAEIESQIQQQLQTVAA